MNRIAGIILGVISITVQANPFQVFDGDGSFFTNKIGPGDELLVFCYNHLDDIDREKLIGSLVRPHIQEITSRSFSCFYRNAFLLGDVDLGKLEQECWRRRIKVIATKLLYLTLFYSPLAFWACLRLRRMKTHRTACVVIYCVVWIAICTMTLFSSINSSDIGANLLLTVGCVAHAIYLCAALCRMMKRSM